MVPQYKSTFEEQYSAYGRNSKEHGQTIDVIMTSLFHVKASSKLRVLSLGSGNGQFDILLAKALVNRLGKSVTIDYTCVEPDKVFNEMFQSAIKKDSCQQLANNVSFGFCELTYEDFILGWEAERKLYDLVVFSNSLGAMGDKTETLKQAIKELLTKQGSCIVIEATENEGCQKFINAMMKTSLCSHVGIGQDQPPLEDILGENIDKLVERLSLKHNKITFTAESDLSPCFDEDSMDGNLILDFMVFKENARQHIPADVMRQILDVLRSVTTQENGRQILKSEIIAVSIPKQ